MLRSTWLSAQVGPRHQIPLILVPSLCVGNYPFWAWLNRGSGPSSESLPHTMCGPQKMSTEPQQKKNALPSVKPIDPKPWQMAISSSRLGQAMSSRGGRSLSRPPPPFPPSPFAHFKGKERAAWSGKSGKSLEPKIKVQMFRAGLVGLT